MNESISASQEERSRQLLEKDSEHAFDAFAGKLSLPVLFVDSFFFGELQCAVLATLISPTSDF